MSSRRVYRRREYIPRMYTPKSAKYQFVPFSINAGIPAGSDTSTIYGVNSVIVPQSNVAGIRKVKNFYINFTTNSSIPIIFAIVYAPEGANVENLRPNINQVPSDSYTFTELFEANQWVIGCGSIVNGAVNQFRTRMSRNLNNGDSVFLFLWMASGQPPEELTAINATGNYAIRYN